MRGATLGEPPKKFPTATRLRPGDFARLTKPQHRWCWSFSKTPPKVARPSQPWALGHNPFGIKTFSSLAHSRHRQFLPGVFGRCHRSNRTIRCETHHCLDAAVDMQFFI